MENAKKLIVIDGNSLLFRAYYATAYGENPSIMRTKDGTPTNAIFAFANMLTKILSTLKGGESIFVGFDADSHTFRKDQLESYKANRKPCPEDLIKQFPISRELLDAMGILHYEVHGLEADDLCGTLATMASKQGYKVDIYTSDKDYLQLIDDNITINLLKIGLSNMEIMTPTSMVEKFGFSPKQIVDFKGLKGDPSDNLPGIPGVGDKTAVKLIQDYGSFDGIMEAAKTMKGKLGENLRQFESQGRICFDLAHIKVDAELPFTLEDAIYQGYEFSTVNTFSLKYEFRQLINRLPVKFKLASNEAAEIETHEVSSIDNFDFGNEIGLYADIDDDYHNGELNGLAISTKKDAIYISSEYLNNPKLIEVLENSEIKKCIYNVKSFVYTLSKLGIKTNGIVFDPLIAAYLLDSSSTFTVQGVFASFGVDIKSGEPTTMNLFSTKNISLSGNIAFKSLVIKDKVLRDLSENGELDLFNNIELPLSSVLAKMEIEGFPADKKILTSIGNEYKAKVAELEKQIKETAGQDFNVGSPKQVAKVLFEDLKLPDNKGGSTAVEALTSIIDSHPVIPLILEHRKYSKLVSTYTDGLIPHIDGKGYIHTFFNQAQTTTGRLSSSNPNLQNISTRDEEGRKIKQAFYYEDNSLNIVSFDYGQIELRILASLANSEDYKAIFKSDRDVHSETAKKIFMVDEPTNLQRRKAKAVNFAIIYGTTTYGLAEQIQVSPSEASEIISNFYSSYPELRDYLNSIIDEVEMKGYVTTMFGRRRYFRDITDPNYNKREAAKRAALNAPIQGSAADLIKIAMLKVAAYLKENDFKTKMVLQIHDELIFKVPDEELSFIIPKIKEIMENCVELPVKLVVEAGNGKSWYDAKE